MNGFWSLLSCKSKNTAVKSNTLSGGKFYFQNFETVIYTQTILFMQFYKLYWYILIYIYCYRHICILQYRNIFLLHFMTMFYHKTLDYIDITAMYAFDRKINFWKYTALVALKLVWSCGCTNTIIPAWWMNKKTKNKNKSPPIP